MEMDGELAGQWQSRRCILRIGSRSTPDKPALPRNRRRHRRRSRLPSRYRSSRRQNSLPLGRRRTHRRPKCNRSGLRSAAPPHMPNMCRHHSPCRSPDRRARHRCRWAPGMCRPGRHPHLYSRQSSYKLRQRSRRNCRRSWRGRPRRNRRSCSNRLRYRRTPHCKRYNPTHTNRTRTRSSRCR